MAKRRRRETEQERALRERRERVELLKMKQGLIEESEAIPETGYVKMDKPRGWSKISNFFYRNKWFVGMGVFLAAIFTVGIVQLATREKPDLNVLAVVCASDSQMNWRAKSIELALERYCPDFDGNGKVHVSVHFIDRTRYKNPTDQYDMAQDQKFTAEFLTAESQLFLTDETFINWMFVEEAGEGAKKLDEVFLKQTDRCSKDVLYDECGVRLSKTDFASEAKWSSCPDSVMFFVRREIQNGVADPEKTAVSRERALIVIQNILDGNVVNPDITVE